MRRNRIVYVALAGAALCTLGCGRDKLVTGIANSGNVFYANPVIDELAQRLADSDATPPVTDAMLLESFRAIADGAAKGQPEAALILFRVAEAQRERQRAPES